VASRRLLVATCVTLYLASGGATLEGLSPQQALTPEAEDAIAAGVAFLVRTQNPDGSWLSEGSTGRYPTAMTALAGLALAAGGNTCYSGPHARSVRRAVEYLLQQSDPETGIIGGQESGRPMFGHGFAMLFLAQVYGSEGQAALRERIRDVLVRAVGLTVRAQGRAGGWYYTPDATQDEGAVTVTQIQALRACADAGIPVPQETVDRAMDYIRRSLNPDGGVAYQADRPGDSRPGITCAALATMHALGIYEGEMVENALRFARSNVPLSAPTPAGGTHFFYSHLYLSQVLYFRGGPDWHEYFTGIRTWLVDVQQEDGSWNGEYIGKVYGTAVALLILQLPYNSLPVFQR